MNETTHVPSSNYGTSTLCCDRCKRSLEGKGYIQIDGMKICGICQYEIKHQKMTNDLYYSKEYVERLKKVNQKLNAIKKQYDDLALYLGYGENLTLADLEFLLDHPEAKRSVNLFSKLLKLLNEIE